MRQLGDSVTIACSGESGEIVGRAEYKAQQEALYLVRYKDGTGCAVERWWPESALK